MELKPSSVRGTTLFRGLTDEDIQKMGECITARERVYERGSFIFHTGDDVRSVYYIISGSVHILDEDFWGNRSIIEVMGKDILFGEAYVFSAMESHLVSVVAAENSVILEIDPKTLFETCPKQCECHMQLVRNVLSIVSTKIVRLTEKMIYVTQRSIRDKLLLYLSKCAQKAKSNSFDILYSRQQLADYLCIDRSALSHELSRMQKQGLLKYNKHHFELLGEHGKM